MRGSHRIARLLYNYWRSGWRRSDGSEIVEFAVSLPLLVVLVVSIYDFGSAFTLKQKLTGVVREGARIAASQQRPIDPSSDCVGAPSSVCEIRDIVASSLTGSNLSACGLNAASAAHGGANSYIWTFTGSCAGATLKVERDVVNTTTGTLTTPFDTASYHVENTRVTLTYPYQWQFNEAFKLLDRSANYLTSTITVTATMQGLE